MDHTPDPVTGERIGVQQRHHDLMEEAELADRLCLNIADLATLHDDDGRIGQERGWGPVGRPQFDFEIPPNGAMLLGDPETVARKIIREHQLFGFTRFSLKFSVGSMPHDRMLRCIQLYATEVVPRVRKAVGA